MGRQSFADWRLPGALDGVLLYEDLAGARSRFRRDERHFHDELELHFVERGLCSFVLRDRQLDVPAGALLWIPPGRDHLLLETSPDLRRWLLLVRRRVLPRVLPKSACARLMGPQRAEAMGVLAPRAAAMLKRTYSELRPQIRGELPLANAAIAYALARSHSLYEGVQTSPATSAFHPAVSRAVRALREAGPPASLRELARRCQVSEAHLSKLFSEQLGISITDFRNRIRLERFLQLYGDGTRHTLMAAALDAGFGSYAQFHRVFRRAMGYSPGEHVPR
jgi:AraC-like DNA-binding protein